MLLLLLPLLPCAFAAAGANAGVVSVYTATGQAFI
jgi:hypothetical protein